MGRRPNPWTKLSLDAWSLALESASVVGLRTLKLAAGGAAADVEGRRMVEEKMRAGLELQTMAMMGGLGITPRGAAAKTVAHYRRKVRANQRRLLES